MPVPTICTLPPRNDLLFRACLGLPNTVDPLHQYKLYVFRYQ